MENGKPSYQELEVRIKELESELKRYTSAGKSTQQAKHSFTPENNIQSSGKESFNGDASEDEIKYRTIFKQSGEGILLIRDAIIECNDAACRILQMSKNEIIGRVPADFSPEGQNDRNSKELQEKIWSKAYAGIPQRFNWKCTRGDGQLIELDVHVQVITLQGKKALLATGRDITSFKKIETELKNNQQFLQNVFNAIQDGISVLDTNLNVIRTNSWMENMYNKQLPLEGRKCYHKFQERRTPCPWCPSLKTIKTGKTWTEIVPYPSENDIKGWIELSSFPIKNDNGEVINVIEYVKDVTKQKIAEQALRNSEEKFRSFVEQSHEGIMLIDEKGMIDEWNSAMEKIVGFDGEKAIRRFAWDIQYELVPEAKKNETLYTNIKSRLQRFLKNGEAEWIDKTREITIPQKNGEYKTIEEFAFPIRTEKGFMMGIIFRDITERKYAEEALRESEEKYRILAETTQDIILLHDMEGNVVYVNKAGLDFKGFENRMKVGVNIIDFTPNQQVEETQIRKEKRESGDDTTFRYELNFPDSRGNMYPVEIHSTPVFRKGKVNEILIVARDITERKNAENELKLKNEEYLSINEELRESLQQIQRMNIELEKAKRKAEESDRLKTAFLCNMSHEIRTPMNGIIGFSELLNEPGTSEEDRSYFSEIIQNSGQQLLTIVNNILDISKIETGQMEVQFKNVSLNKIISDTYTFFKPQAQKNGISLYPKKSLPDESGFVKTDEMKLQQVLNNLINNSLKFTSAGYIEFGYQLRDNVVEFFVRDTGIGIRKDLHEAIFERFQQGETGLNRQHGGAGLGLSICKSLVGLLGGRIWFESEENKGTNFYFTIPFTQEVSKRIVSKPSTEKSSISPVIMVVEDEEVNFLYMEEVLKVMNLEILHAKDGEEAVEICRQRADIKLILMDIKLPVMNGYEATKEIKKIRSDVPIVAQTAYAMTTDKEEALSTGCDDYISKPIKKAELIDIVKKYLV